MHPQFSVLSRRTRIIKPNGAGPIAIIDRLLRELSRILDDTLVGHAKIVAHIDGKVLRASTTGSLESIKITPPPNVDYGVRMFEFETLCVFHGVSFTRLNDCWRAAVAAVTATGVEVCDEAVLDGNSVAEGKINAGSMSSMAASFVALKPCCVLPAVGAMSGGSLGMLQFLEIFEPWRPLLIVFACLLLSSSFYRLLWRPVAISSEQQERSVRRGRRLLYAGIAALIIATVTPLLINELDISSVPHSHHG